MTTQLSANLRLPNGYRERLSKPMPKEAIKAHPTKTYLSTIKAIYVVERLNDVFGICGWDFEHEVVGTFDNTTEKDGKSIKMPYIMVKGRIYIREFDMYTPYQYGGHEIDGKGTEPADGFKSAVTDAMSKCASLLEIGIQVFKGNPSSAEINTSKRLDVPVEKKTEVVTKTDDPVVEKRIDEMNKVVPKTEDEEARPDLMTKKKKVVKKEVPEEITTSEQAGQLLADTTKTIEIVSVVEKYSKAILTYLDSATLKNEAADIIFNATIDGASEDEKAEIKILINSHWKKLKDGGK